MERKKPVAKSRTPKKRIAKTAPRKAPSKKTVKRAVTKPATGTQGVARRAIFVDVENTSSEAALLKILDHLKIERTVQPTELTAVGNWKSVGTKVARMLAGLGAHLVHSAPAAGVRDWSDLWIAVAAGRWLATASPGDTLELVSDDRAFDAVGDAAAAAGVVFKRISYRSLHDAAPPAAISSEGAPRRRRRRGGRGRSGASAAVPPGERPSAASMPAPSPVPRAHPTAPPSTTTAEEEAHAAPHAQIHAILARLGGGTTRWINLDAVANALKSEGHVRPPGSPRLVVRLRRMKDVEVSSNGMVRLAGAAATATAEAALQSEPTRESPPRARRRGGRRRRGSGGAAVESSPPADSAT